MRLIKLLIVCFALFPILQVSAAVLYVNVNNPSPAAPYGDWSTAATNIQTAIDASTNGDLVLVTNGVYRFGGKFIAGISNRVAIVRPVRVQSVNGPQVTMISASTGGIRTSIRCAYVTNGAVLSGFTLTNGLMLVGQGIANDPIGFGAGAYCQSVAAMLTNCLVVSNSAAIGGGVYQGTLNNCVIFSNMASAGGGAYQSVLNNCAVVGNFAGYGGGAALGTLNNCTLVANSASSFGGGAASNSLNNCIAYYNNAPTDPNCSSCVLNYSCTTPLPAGGVNSFTNEPLLAGAYRISAASPCRGAGSAVYNGGVDIDAEAWSGLPSVGCDEFVPGNFTGPLAVGIAASYTNVAVGFTVSLVGQVMGHAAANAWDFGDGASISNHPYMSHAWANGGDYTVTFTAYNDDFPGGVSAAQLVHVVTQNIFYVSQSNAVPVAPYADWTTAATNIQDALDLAVLPGQSVLVSNGVYQTGGRIFGATATSNRVVVIRPVRVTSVNGPLATSIVGQRGTGGGVGANAIRCVYLAAGATLDGFTLTGGSTTNFDDGGGVFCPFTTSPVVTNCIFYVNYAKLGGGAYFGTLNNCTFMGNSSDFGGAAYDSTLNNCLVSGNAVNNEGGGLSGCIANNCVIYNNRGSINGGGARFCTLNNCILRKNVADNGGGDYSGTLNNCTVVDNYAYVNVGGTYQSTANNCIIYANGSSGSIGNSSGGTLNYCCTTPLFAGTGNFTNNPLLINIAGGDFHIPTNSPCINAGKNSLAAGTVDLDGNMRIAGGTVDVGAYEIASPASTISYAWLQRFQLPNDGSADNLDPDGDGFKNWQEWRTGTDPTNAASLMQMVSATPTNNASGVTVKWQSVSGVNYFIQRGGDLSAQPPFITIQSGIIGAAGTTSFKDTNAVGAGPFCYRVGVQ